MYLILLRYELDYLLRANAYARAACHAVFSVDSRNTVYYSDSVELAGVHTIAESDASEHTSVRRREPALRAFAGLHALPFEYGLGCFTCSVAHYLRYLWFCGTGSSAEDLGDLSGYSSSARGALCTRKLFISYQVCRVVIASRESAAAAVGARQYFSDLCDSFVYSYMEYLGGKYQQAGADEANDCY